MGPNARKRHWFSSQLLTWVCRHVHCMYTSNVYTRVVHGLSLYPCHRCKTGRFSPIASEETEAPRQRLHGTVRRKPGSPTSMPMHPVGTHSDDTSCREQLCSSGSRPLSHALSLRCHLRTLFGSHQGAGHPEPRPLLGGGGC